jgi:hypothetical protein
MRRQIVSSVRAGESVTRVAERLLDLDKPIVRLPQHVSELRDAAQMALHRGDRNIYLDAVQKWRSRVEELGQGPEGGPGAHTMRSATQQLVKDLGSAKLEQIDHIAERWVLERARYQARVIARTETVEAFRDVYKETTARQPYVVGYRWQLSGSHPRPDECDVYASQDVDGLGPGGYLPGNIPSSPHPHDLCSQVAIIDNQFFKRELAKKTGAEEPPKPWESGTTVSAKDWLAKQPEGFQRQLLGPTLHKAFGAGRNVLDPQGKPLPVHVVLNTRKPVRQLGPAVDASAAVRRDRHGQVRPFPKVAGAPRAPKPAVQRVAKLTPARIPSVKSRPAEETHEHWLRTEFEVTYGAETGRAVAWGKAMEYRGRSTSFVDARSSLDALAKAGVALPTIAGTGGSPLDWVEAATGRSFTTLGDAIAHIEGSQPVEAAELIELRASATLVGHARSITKRGQPIDLATPRVEKSARLSLKRANSAVQRARGIFQELGDASLVHPESSTHDWVSTREKRGYYRIPRGGMRGHIDLGIHAPRFNVDVDQTAVHEWGHALENLNPRLRDRARDYLDRRAAGEPLIRLSVAASNPRYKPYELTRPDKLFDPYMGKHYPVDTEVTSMLVQQFAKRGGLADVLRRDPDSFYFLFGQLRGQ